MTENRAKAFLEIEKQCINRNCDRNCAKCDIVQQLEDYGNEEIYYYKNTPYEKCIEECIGKAIQIAKGGGVDG